jgi:DNA primase
MSGRIPRAFIDELLARVDVVEIINARVKLQRRGTNHMACCPFHDEKTPSFSVSQTKQIYHCFGCGVGGNAISFLMDYERMAFVEAIEMLAAQVGMPVPKELIAGQTTGTEQGPLYQLLAEIAVYYQQQLAQTEPAQAYVAKRGISTEIAKRFALGFAPAGWDNVLRIFGGNEAKRIKLKVVGMLIEKDNGRGYDRFRERLMFPIRCPRGRVLGFGGRTLGDGTPKYLNSPETTIFHKGQELYGLYEALQQHRQLEQAVVVEGYMDVIALAEHGITYALATLGTATSREHLQSLFRYTDKVVFCFDGDSAGRQAAWRALEISLPLLQDGKQVGFMFLPQSHDPDSFVRERGAEGFSQALAAAIGLPDFLLEQLGAGVNLDHMDGLARLTSLAMPMVEQIPGKILQQMLLDKLSQVVRMSPDKLRRFMVSTANKGQPATRPAVHTNRKRLTASASPVRLAVSLVLQYPELAKALDLQELASNGNVPGVAIFNQVVQQIQENPQGTAGSLLEYWRNTEHYGYLNKLAAWQHGVPEAGLVAEFEGTLELLKALVREEKIEQLLAKASLEGLSLAEKKVLQALISRKQRQEAPPV